MRTQTFLTAFAFLVIIMTTAVSCSKTSSPMPVISSPTLTTTDASDVTKISAISGGSISSDGGGSITTRGVCWNTSINPTIYNSKTSDGFGTGSFVSNITGLLENTIYHVRAYATNSSGIAYGNDITFTTPQTVIEQITIGGQTWMAKNLDVSTYRNGDTIPEIQDPRDMYDLTTGAWCYYKNSTANGIVYGKLYNLYATIDPRGLAPFGWHIPTAADWNTLFYYLGGPDVAGGKLKSITGWTMPNIGATDSSRFDALPGGIREAEDIELGSTGQWWTSPYTGDMNVYFVSISYDQTYAKILSGFVEHTAVSVRCIKN